MSSDYNPFLGPQSPNPFQQPQPFGPPQPNQYGQPTTPSRLSVTALFSMLVALISPVGCIFCIPTLLGSIGAIVLGHVSLAKIYRSGGLLSGKPFAYAGLAMGYTLLLLSLVSVPFYFKMLGEPKQDPLRAALNAAESKVFSDNDGVASGNGLNAEAMASQFATAMKNFREQAITKSKSTFKLSGGNFVTHCEFHPGRCVFIVHVPELRNYTDDAKELMATTAWQVANQIASERMNDGDALGVGMRGALLYSDVMVGKVSRSGGGPATHTKDNDDLLPFFDPLPSATPIAPVSPTDEPDAIILGPTEEEAKNTPTPMPRGR